MAKGKQASTGIDVNRISLLYDKVTIYIDTAKQSIKQTIDVEMIKAYWLIGRDIVKDEQSGSATAEYGTEVLKQLSQKLQQTYQRGFSVDVLEKARKFYIIYQGLDQGINSATVSRKSSLLGFYENLSWSHYVELIKIKRDDARSFYALEASQNGWTVRELRRQIDSFLYDRLTKAKNKKEIMNLAHKGQEINSPQDAIKEPLVLEFLGVKEPHNLSETKLESALITNLQSFLLELGKGFAFVARQKRLTFGNKHFYADLVFYHVILKCYIIVDLKTHELSHGDLGQIQLYVNYFDMEVKQENDNPTVGLVLCTEKSDEMVKYQLGEKAKQIFASTYQFHLPTEEELERELKREIKAIKHSLANTEEGETDK